MALEIHTLDFCRLLMFRVENFEGYISFVKIRERSRSKIISIIILKFKNYNKKDTET